LGCDPAESRRFDVEGPGRVKRVTGTLVRGARSASPRARGYEGDTRVDGHVPPHNPQSMRELQQQKELRDERVRQAGGGRKRLEESNPGLRAALERIMGESTAGNPMSLLR
jgi:hypothetical protein